MSDLNEKKNSDIVDLIIEDDDSGSHKERSQDKVRSEAEEVEKAAEEALKKAEEALKEETGALHPETKEEGDEQPETEGTKDGGKEPEQPETEGTKDGGKEPEQPEAEGTKGGGKDPEQPETEGGKDGGKEPGQPEAGEVKKEETPDKSKEESIMPQEHGVYVDEKAFVREKKRHKALVIITTVLAGLFIAGYTFMVINSIFYFQPNTVINGVDYSFRTEESVQKEIDDKMSDYKLHITLRNGEITLRPEDIGLVITTKNDVHSIKEKQNPFLWFVTYFGAPDEAAYEISYDPALMESFLRNNSYFMASSMISPQNPRIVMADGVPEIRKGNPGTLIDMDRFREVLDEKLQHLDTEFRPDSEGCYVNAEYTEDSPEVKDYRDQIESYTGLKMTYVFAETKIPVTAEQIYSMLDLDPERFSCTVSRDRVKRFVSDFAADHNTFGRIRDFRTHDGKIAHVTNNYMGWEIDQENEVSMMYDALYQKHGFERTPELLHEGTIYTKDNSDIGNSYVEIDLTYQKVFFYMNGKKVLEDDVISGNPNRNAQTPGGLYAIYGMRQNVVLTGPGYASHVDYWMPFNGEIGLHDAYWQSKFGGELYKSRGSHGCVNLPHQTAETIYTLGYRGLPVVCYWRTPEFF